jgi:hypothetical protein
MPVNLFLGKYEFNLLVYKYYGDDISLILWIMNLEKYDIDFRIKAMVK